LLYGEGIPALAASLGISIDEATELEHTYWKELPKVDAWKKKSHAFLKKHGYSLTLLGRRRWILQVYSQSKKEISEALRRGPNMEIQGLASDIALTAMGRSWQRIKDLGIESYPYAFVHDASVFDCSPGTFFDVMEISYYEMVVVPKLLYPWVICRTEASFDIGVNLGWLVEANFVLDKDRNPDHNMLDLRGSEGNIDAFLNEVSVSQRVEVMKSGPHPNSEEAKTGAWQKIVHVDRPNIRALLHDSNLHTF
jgi:hypothetical protein